MSPSLLSTILPLVHFDHKPAVRPSNSDLGQQGRNKRRDIEESQNGDRLSVLLDHVDQMSVIGDHGHHHDDRERNASRVFAFLARSTTMGFMRNMGFVGTENLQLTEAVDA